VSQPDGAHGRPGIAFTLNGRSVDVDPVDASLLDALRGPLGVRSVKDGCSPQGQCGCCTVLVDGQPRVACVTPLARVAGRDVTTLEGLAGAGEWCARFGAAGATQCGFCTPGIIVRAAASHPTHDTAARQLLLAHLCRCTGWNTVVEAITGRTAAAECVDPAAAARRAQLEGGGPQSVGAHVAGGGGGFAADTAPDGCLIALLDQRGEWVVGETMTEARRLAARVQGRRTTEALHWPVAVPPGEWLATLQTTWVEPAYLEPDASWCLPGGEPTSPLANGGAFGGKTESGVAAAARRLADLHGRAVLAQYLREDVARLGPKRPPIAAGIGHDGRVVVHAARTAGLAELLAGLDVQLVEHDVAGPPTSLALRGAGWVEVAVLRSRLAAAPDQVVAPGGGQAWATVDDHGVHVGVRCGVPLDPTVLRSYCIGAAHMALGWVRSEGIAVDEAGAVHDLTIRSFGVLRAVDTPPITVEIIADDAEPVNGSDAVFAAVAAAAWRHSGWAPRWPTMRT
jgi:aerobic-type carbon monoxide dehydrogenase small subunit (CoxS/CutS family)